MKTMVARGRVLADWPIGLFAPPPFAAMSRGQKLVRIFCFSITLIVTCIILAMAGAVSIFLFQRGRAMLGDIPELRSGLEIVFTGVCVNAICVGVLLQVRKMDRKLIMPVSP